MGGRLHPEWWQVCPGISGRVGPEYALTQNPGQIARESSGELHDGSRPPLIKKGD